MKLLLVAGARPNFMKIAPLIKEIKRHNNITKKRKVDWILVHTGQHYDDEMSKVFFVDLEIPQPHIYLGVGSGTHAIQTAKIMIAFEKVCLEEKPDIILVVGDVNSTIACSLVASKLGIKVAHIEAGLRSFDRSMPEEINRLLTDSISDFLFTSCEDANENLKAEGIPKEKIYFVGNVMIDTLLSFKKKSQKSQIMKYLHIENSKNEFKDFALVTLHRPSNVDNCKNFGKIIKVLYKVSNHLPIIFPVHPRTQKQIKLFHLDSYFNFFNYTKTLKNIVCINPLAYLDFLKLMTCAKIVLTDSGGIQEETTILGIPCLTLRENTERPITIKEGTNELVGGKLEKIEKYTAEILDGKWKKGKIPKFWDGKAAKRIVKILAGKSF